MNEANMIALVTRYFTGVDEENFDEIAATLTPDCVFTVETHGVRLVGLEAISAMFTRLWAAHAAVLHKDFTYTAAPEHGRIAAQFTVVNTETDGSLTYKSNCNFFVVDNGKFSRVAVYMAGPNTLNVE